jgi:dGTP triphosphohydrolase
MAFFEKESNILNIHDNQREYSSYLVEMADDICHVIGDIADGIRCKFISLTHFKNWLVSFVDQEFYETILIKLNEEKYELLDEQIFEIFLEQLMPIAETHFYSITNGSQENLEYDNYLSLLTSIKSYISKFIFTKKEKVYADLAGYVATQNALTIFGKLLKLSKENFYFLIEDQIDYSKVYRNNLDLDYKIAALLHKKWVHIYLNKIHNVTAEEEWHLRAHLILDTLVGMTNQDLLDFKDYYA